jgi:hypothetical protein
MGIKKVLKEYRSRLAEFAKPCSQTHIALQTARQEIVGKSSREHIVQQKIQYAPRHICRQSLASCLPARSRQSLGLVRKNRENLTVTFEKERNREWQPKHLTSGLLQAGLTSRDRYAENQTLARVENSLETPPAASRHHVAGNRV